MDGVHSANIVPQEPEPAKTQESAKDPAPAKASSGVGKLLLGAVGGLVVGAVVTAAVFLTALIGGGTARAEGPGFDTAEAAAQAYVEALRDKDLDAVISAYAVESFVAHCDFEAYLVRTQAYTPFTATQTCPFPGDDELGVAGNAKVRLQSVTADSVQFLSTAVVPSLWNDGQTIMFDDEDDIQEFLDGIETGLDDYAPARMTNVTAVSPESLSEVYDSESAARQVEAIAGTLGLSTDDFVDVAVTFDLDGQTWVFAPSVGRYSGKWYIVSSRGLLATLLGPPANAAPIFPLE